MKDVRQMNRYIGILSTEHGLHSLDVAHSFISHTVKFNSERKPEIVPKILRFMMSGQLDMVSSVL